MKNIVQSCPGASGKVGMLVTGSVWCFMLCRQCLSSSRFELFLGEQLLAAEKSVGEPKQMQLQAGQLYKPETLDIRVNQS